MKGLFGAATWAALVGSALFASERVAKALRADIDAQVFQTYLRSLEWKVIVGQHVVLGARTSDTTVLMLKDAGRDGTLDDACLGYVRDQRTQYQCGTPAPAFQKFYETLQLQHLRERNREQRQI